MGLIGAVLGAAAAVATGAVAPRALAPADRTAIEAVVRDYILDHPEIVPEAVERLQAREQARAIAAQRHELETPFAGAWEGAANGDVVVVEFFDYACGYCRASVPDVDRLLREDARVKIVYRELPVLGPDSEAAAALALGAAARTGRYAAVHRALYAARPDANARAAVARRFGLATPAPDAAAAAEIQRNYRLQAALRITGTPSWIVGGRLLAGAVGYDALKAAVAEARRSSGQR